MGVCCAQKAGLGAAKVDYEEKFEASILFRPGPELGMEEQARKPPEEVTDPKKDEAGFAEKAKTFGEGHGGTNVWNCG